ncbi:hypothetical protein KSS87_008358 [Heliosperma pusillum]|nr:hypothetical protein KSS87_008358 [Heliosperma pusillum]
MTRLLLQKVGLENAMEPWTYTHRAITLEFIATLQKLSLEDGHFLCALGPPIPKTLPRILGNSFYDPKRLEACGFDVQLKGTLLIMDRCYEPKNATYLRLPHPIYSPLTWGRASAFYMTPNEDHVHNFVTPPSPDNVDEEVDLWIHRHQNTREFQTNLEEEIPHQVGDTLMLEAGEGHLRDQTFEPQNQNQQWDPTWQAGVNTYMESTRTWMGAMDNWASVVNERDHEQLVAVRFSEMATEKNTSSVLAKLMGIDRLLVPCKTRARLRVLSDSYLRNDSSVFHVDKAVLDGNTNVFIIDGDDNAECEETLEFAEKGSVDGHQSVVRGDANSRLITYSDDSRMKNVWDEVTFSPKTPSFKHCQGFDQRGLTGSHSLPGHLVVQSPFSASHSSQAQNYKSIKTHLGQRRSFYNIDAGSTNKKQKTAAFGVNSKGLSLQERRANSLRHNNGMEYSDRGNLSVKDIAKQITYQVNHSVWHDCIKDSRYEGRFDKSETENKPEMSPSNTPKRSSRNTQKTKSESWSAKRHEKVGTCHRRKTEHQLHVDGIPRKYDTPCCKDVNSCMLSNSNAYRFRVASARFLSKPTLFPSAWVPKSKERCFTLDRNWCLRPENKNSNRCSESSEDIDINRSCTSDSAKLLEENTLDDAFSAFRETEEVTLDDKMDMSSNLQGGKRPVRLNKSIMFDGAASSLKDFQEHELKSKTSPPGSPVSSLEGPEACRRRLNFIVSSKDDVLGLPTKLHLIEAMSTESGSEGPGMVISSDASDAGGSTVCYREDTQIEEPTSESCHFSYLVDVIVESGMLMGNLEMESYVLDPSIFDLLEKKYGKSELMERSERRLLFDRIKSGLMDILQPCVGVHSWRKPVVKRLRSMRRSWEFVEEELWGLLVNQEEVKSNLFDKFFDCGFKWLDLEEDVVVMVEEIQRLLIDELVEELSVEMLGPW